MPLRQIILGSPLPTADYVHQHLSKVKALAVFSSDALSSVAYATEEILLGLVTAGLAALETLMPIALVITGLLVIVMCPTIYADATAPRGRIRAPATGGNGGRCASVRRFDNAGRLVYHAPQSLVRCGLHRTVCCPC